MEKVKVSIIIPVYNSELYLHDTIGSLLTQTLTEIEIICINDGSNDHSFDILREYADKDSRVIVIDQKNAGQSAARNAGLKKALGEYVYFLDSDDRIVPEALEQLYEIAAEKHLDLLLFDGTSFYESKELEEKYPNYKTYYQHKFAYEKMDNGESMYARMTYNRDFKVSPCLQFIRREHLLEKDIWFPEGIIHEDNYFAFINMINSERVMCIRESYFLRRVREDSVMTKKVTYKNYQGYYSVAYKILETIHEKNFRRSVVISASRQTLQHFRALENIYQESLTDEEKSLIENNRQLSGIPYQFFMKPLSSMAYLNKQVKDYAAENKKLKKQIDKIYQSKTYKIGRAFTWLPRKVKSFLGRISRKVYRRD